MLTPNEVKIKCRLVNAMRYIDGLGEHYDKNVKHHYNCLLIEAKIAELELLDHGLVHTYRFDPKCFISQFIGLNKNIDILSFRDKIFLYSDISLRRDRVGLFDT